VAGVPVFGAFPGRVLGMPGGGSGSRWSARGGRTTWRPVLLPAHAGKGRERVCGCGDACPVCSRAGGRRAAAFIDPGDDLVGDLVGEGVLDSRIFDQRRYVGDVPAGVRDLVRRPHPSTERGARIQPRMISSAATGVRQLNRRRRARRGAPRGSATSALGASRSGRSPEPGPSLAGAWPSLLWVAGMGHLPSHRAVRAAVVLAGPVGRGHEWPGQRRALPGRGGCLDGSPLKRAPKVATRAVARAGAASSASPVSAARSVTPLTWSRSSFQAARAPWPGEDIRHPDGVPRDPEGTSPQAPRSPARRGGPGTR
jgi:hypothetical protein